MNAALARRSSRLVGVASLAVVVVGKQYYRDATAERPALDPRADRAARVVVHRRPLRLRGGRRLGRLRSSMFVIAPACAGVNFALAAFLALALGGLAAMTSCARAACALAIAAALAYVATLVVNTVADRDRVQMHRARSTSRADRGELHRLEGIVVYLGGLCVLYALARSLDGHRLRKA